MQLDKVQINERMCCLRVSHVFVKFLFESFVRSFRAPKEVDWSKARNLGLVFIISYHIKLLPLFIMAFMCKIEICQIFGIEFLSLGKIVPTLRIIHKNSSKNSGKVTTVLYK